MQFLYVFVCFLEKTIQASSHNSIEDARTALQLRDKYNSLQKEHGDAFTTILKQLYEHGRALQWRVPSVTDDSDVTDAAGADAVETELQEIMWCF